MDLGIFLVGVCVFLILAGGLVFTVLEFRKIDREPERFRPGKNRWSEHGEKHQRVA